MHIQDRLKHYGDRRDHVKSNPFAKFSLEDTRTNTRDTVKVNYMYMYMTHINEPRLYTCTARNSCIHIDQDTLNTYLYVLGELVLSRDNSPSPPRPPVDETLVCKAHGQHVFWPFSVQYMYMYMH